MAITTLNSADSGATSRTVINDNFTDLDTTKADLASPTFTGTPSLPTGTTAVTQTAGDNSTKIATTEYVENVIGDVSCRVYQTSSTTLTTQYAWYVMDFGAESFDTDTMHDNATNPSRITFTTAGTYAVGGNAQIAANNISVGIKIRVDGTTDIASQKYCNGVSTNNSANVSTIYAFTAGQYIEFLASSPTNAQGTSGDLMTNAWAYKIN